MLFKRFKAFAVIYEVLKDEVRIKAIAGSVPQALLLAGALKFCFPSQFERGTANGVGNCKWGRATHSNISSRFSDQQNLSVERLTIFAMNVFFHIYRYVNLLCQHATLVYLVIMTHLLNRM